MLDSVPLFNAVTIGLTAIVTYQAFTDPSTGRQLIFEPARILRNGEYYRILSSGLIHADWAHFAVNMFSLYAFGSGIERTFGGATFLGLYLAGIIGGNVLSLYLHRRDNYRALGASGGVCGIIFASIFLIPGGTIYVFPLPIGIPAPVYAILFIFWSFIGIQRQADNIGHDAHLGGALIGLLMATLSHPYILRESLLLYLVVVITTVALFAYTYRVSRHR